MFGRRDPLRPYMDQLMDTLHEAGVVDAALINRGRLCGKHVKQSRQCKQTESDVWNMLLLCCVHPKLNRQTPHTAAAGVAAPPEPPRRGSTPWGADDAADDFFTRRDIAKLRRRLCGSAEAYQRSLAVYTATVTKYIHVCDERVSVVYGCAVVYNACRCCLLTMSEQCQNDASCLYMHVCSSCLGMCEPCAFAQLHITAAILTDVRPQVHQVAHHARNPERMLSALTDDTVPWRLALAKAQWWWTCKLRKPMLRCALSGSVAEWQCCNTC